MSSLPPGQGMLIMSALPPRNELARSLTRIAANDPTLTRFSLNGWETRVQGAKRLIVALQGNTVVAELWLRNSGIGAGFLRALVGVLENNTSLEVLSLEGNRFGAEGARAVGRLLRNTSSLDELSLQNCGIGVEGVCLPRNSSLTELYLGGNHAGDLGASALAGALPGNSTLTVLDLHDNGIGDAGATALAEALPHNSSLTRLYLAWNDISDAGARLLVKALLVNSIVTTLNLWRTDISEALQRLVEELAQINMDASNGRINYRVGQDTVISTIDLADRYTSINYRVGLGRINMAASNPQAALERKVEWLRNLDEGGLSLLGFEESGVEEEIRRLEVVCRVGWLVDSGFDGEKEEALALVLDQLEHFMRVDERRRLFKHLLGLPERGMEVASSAGATRARVLYWYAVDCRAGPDVLLTIIRAHQSLCTCKDVRHRLYPFMLLATMEEAGAEDVMELLLLNPNLVQGGIPAVED